MRTTEPTFITQGEQIEWTRTFSDYPAAEWTLQYRFRGVGNGFNVDADADGNDFDVVLTSDQSGEMTSGRYTWQAWVTNIADTDDVRMIDEGTVTVKLGFAEDPTTEIDLRTPARIMLDTLDAALLASGSSDVIEYEISTPAGSRRVKRSSRKEALDLRKYYAGIVAREIAAERLRNGGTYGMAVNLRLHG